MGTGAYGLGMRRVLLLGGILLVLAGCGAAGTGATATPTAPQPVSSAPGTPRSSATTPSPASPSSSASSSASSSPARSPAPGTVPPDWLGTRPLPTTSSGFGEIRPTPPQLRDRRFTLPDQLPELPGTGFTARVTSPAPTAVIARSTWDPGCPVKATDLAWIRLTFWGFDDARHTGELLVNAAVAHDLVEVFGALYARPLPDRGDADHHEGRAERAADRGRQRHRGVQLPAGARGDVVQPARLRARRGRQPVPEPLPQGRPGPPRARRRLPRPFLAAPRDDPPRRPGGDGVLRGSAGAGAAPGTR